MKTYRGVVRGGVVELLEPADLREGTEVEVWVRFDNGLSVLRVSAALHNGTPARPDVGTPSSEDDEAAREAAWAEEMERQGFLRRARPELQPEGYLWEPIEIEGPPLSQTIIEERGRPL